MRRALIQVLVVVLGVVSVGFLRAQGVQKTKPDTLEQGLSGLALNMRTEKLQVMMAEPIDESSPALQAVAQFLQLRPDQIEALLQLLQVRQSTQAPLLQDIAMLQKQLNQLLGSGGAAAAIGQFVIQIYALQEQVALAQQNFLSNFQNLLNPGQRQRLETVSLAAQLQPVVPAFQQLALL